MIHPLNKMLLKGKPTVWKSSGPPRGAGDAEHFCRALGHVAEKLSRIEFPFNTWKSAWLLKSNPRFI